MTIKKPKPKPKSGAASKPVARAQPRPPLILGEAEVPRGSAQQVELKIARLPVGAWAMMPVVAIHGTHPGPTVWLSGAIHGDELNGIEIVRKLAARLNPRELSGTVLAVPMVNVFGVTVGSRYLPDRRDLNRSFPGSPRGSLASQLAHVFWTNIGSRCQLGLDFHTASGGRCNLAHVRCDMDHPQTLELAQAFAPPLMLHSTLRDGSLRETAREADIPVLLFEAGEALRFDEDDVDRGVCGALRVLHALGMTEEAPAAPAAPTVSSRSSKWVRAAQSGFCHIRVRLGQTVAKGDLVAEISDGIRKRQVPVRARVGGVIIGVLRTAAVHRGDAIVHIAEPVA